MRTHARVVIVGGGMMGAGLLYHLAEEGWKDVVLCEKGELTSGSTWHAAGQCPSFNADYSMAQIHHYGNTLYPKLESITGQYVSWHGCGGIRYAMNEAELDWFRYAQGVARNIGFTLEIISPSEIQQRVPYLDVTGVIAGALTTEDGHVDPAGCCNALAAGARNMGADIIRHNRVMDINQLASGEWQVVTEQGNITAEHVVNAGGCYANMIAEWVGLRLPITNMKHHYIVTDPVKEFIESNEEMPVIRDPYCSAYYRQEQKAGLIGIYETSGSREAWADAHGDPAWESENELFEAEFDSIMPWLERVMERVPIWRDAGLKRTVHGAIPHTPDNNPLLGPAPGLRNYWLCCGSAIGIAQGAGCGKYMAQWMVHGESEINMRGLDARRFGPYANEDYTRAKSFQDYEHMYALHLPGEERPAGRPARTTPLFDKLNAQGCVHTEAFGWERPKWFSLDGREEACGFRRNNVFEVVAEECRAVRERVGILDLSSFAKYDITGPDTATMLDRLCANRLPRKTGRTVLTHMLTHDGMIESEITITRFADDRFYALAGAAAELHDLDMLVQGKLPDERVEIANVSDDYGILVLAGPKSRELLVKLTNADLTNASFRWLTGQEIDVAGAPTRALRISYVGELGWELHVPMALLANVYDAVWEAGQSLGIANFGVYAVNSLRMEKAYRAWGSELTNEITMIEADMERFVDLDKGDFVGRDALLKVKAQGVATKLVYAEVDAADNDPRGGEPVFAGDRCIGITTSGAYGHAIGKSLVFAYVEPDHAASGTEFEIELLNERRKARVLADPAYDPSSGRMRV